MPYIITVCQNTAGVACKGVSNVLGIAKDTSEVFWRYETSDGKMHRYEQCSDVFNDDTMFCPTQLSTTKQAHVITPCDITKCKSGKHLMIIIKNAD